MARFLCGGAIKAAFLQADTGRRRRYAPGTACRKTSRVAQAYRRSGVTLQRLPPARIIRYARAFDVFRQSYVEQLLRPMSPRSQR
jgi:hypothetical protein